MAKYQQDKNPKADKDLTEDTEKEKTDAAAKETFAPDTESETSENEQEESEKSEESGESEESAKEETSENAEEPDVKADEESTQTQKSDKKDKQIEELNDKYRRLFAEFDNFRKRSETEKAGMYAEGEKTVLLKILPLVDNFERALQTVPEDQKETPLAQGIEKTYKAFAAQLKELGVTEIEAVGKEFDANLHNAVMHVEDENQPENVIVEEFQKGYMFKDKVLRYSMVKVAN